MQLNSYLIFKGQCQEAFEFYAKVLGGKIDTMMPHAGSPAEQGTPPEWQDKILRAHMTVGGSVLMGSDAPPGRQDGPTQGFYVNIGVMDVQDGERIFNALAENGKVHMPLAQTFWSKGFGMLVDRFGTPWMINCQ